MFNKLPIFVCLLLILQSYASASTLDDVKKRGFLRCGVNTNLMGFSVFDDKGDNKGQWHGFDVDYCKAVATATLGDAQKVKFIRLTGKERFSALASGEIDMLARNTTWTIQRDTGLNLEFVGINYYDGQGFMAHKKLGIDQAYELNNVSVCVQAGTTSEVNLAEYFHTRHAQYKAVIFDTPEQAVHGFDTGRCDVFTTDQSQLYALRLNLKNATTSLILPDVISKEPLGPVVRDNDPQWINIVRWTHYLMLNAEEYGLNSSNADSLLKSDSPNILRILGKRANYGANMGLAPDWGYQVIKQVGNYGEVFERNLGQKSILKISRGLNALWNSGGLQYAPPPLGN